jgi:hypothetical protein
MRGFLGKTLVQVRLIPHACSAKNMYMYTYICILCIPNQTDICDVESPVKRYHLMLNEHHIFMKFVYTYARLA